MFKTRFTIASVLLTILFLAFPTFARDFTYTYKGQTLTYTVLDEDAKTCETKQGVDEYYPGNPVYGSLVIPETAIDGNGMSYTVVKIGRNGFSQTSLSSITIPESVTSIEDYAFYYCRDIEGNLIIPNSVTSI